MDQQPQDTTPQQHVYKNPLLDTSLSDAQKGAAYFNEFLAPNFSKNHTAIKQTFIADYVTLKANNALLQKGSEKTYTHIKEQLQAHRDLTLSPSRYNAVLTAAVHDKEAEAGLTNMQIGGLYYNTFLRDSIVSGKNSKFSIFAARYTCLKADESNFSKISPLIYEGTSDLKPVLDRAVIDQTANPALSDAIEEYKQQEATAQESRIRKLGWMNVEQTEQPKKRGNKIGSYIRTAAIAATAIFTGLIYSEVKNTKRLQQRNNFLEMRNEILKSENSVLKDENEKLREGINPGNRQELFREAKSNTIHYYNDPKPRLIAAP